MDLRAQEHETEQPKRNPGISTTVARENRLLRGL